MITPALRRIEHHRRACGLKSLRSKFILSFLVLGTIPMILLAYFSYRVYLDILQHNVKTYTREVIDRVDRNLQIYLSDLDRVLELRNDYYNVQFIKLSLAGDIGSNRKFTFRLWEDLNNIRRLKTDLRDVKITTLDGVVVGCYGVTHIDVSRDQLFQALVNRTSKEDATVIWGPHPDWLGGEVFSVGRAIRGDYDNFLGTMSVDVDMELLNRICRDIRLGKTGYIMLVDDNGKIIYHPKPGLIGKKLCSLSKRSSLDDWKKEIAKISAGRQMITVKTFAPANWKIIGISNNDELTAELQRVTGLSLTLIFGTIAVLTLVSIFLASLLTKPIKELRKSMHRASEDLNNNVTIRTDDEIGQLGLSYNQMLARIRQLMEQSVQEQKKLRRTEMIALQEQIKPHFIYNTLDLIIGLLETNQNEDVINMVEALGSFFRTSLSHGQEFITIREEIEHIRNYLYIQRARHGDKYDYQIDVDNDLLEHKTIKLILQPLVENSIYHGVRALEQLGGMITVKGYLRDNGVCFEVIDNGAGMEAWKVAEINRFLDNERLDEQPQQYFGLRNVHERIVLAFGREYGMHIASVPSRGTVVTVRIPLM